MRSSLIVCTLLLMAAVADSCVERPESFYKDAAAARQDGAVARGWIPDWLPRSAHDIHELHDVDTNQGLLAFTFDPTDAPVLMPSCAQVQREELKPVAFTARWWPRDVPPSALVTHRHAYYRCQDGAYLAVSDTDGHLYRWRP